MPPTSDPSKLFATADELKTLASIAGSLATAFQEESEHARLSGRRRRIAQLVTVTLPDELLAEIFAYACAPPPQVDESLLNQNPDFQASDDLAHARSHHHRKMRYSVALACRRWAGVVASTGLLWSSIRIEVLRKKPLAGPYRTTLDSLFTPNLERLQLVINKAKSGTRLHLDIFGGRGLVEVPQQLLEVLRKEFPRCATVSIVLDARTPFIIPLEETGPQLPHLLALRIEQRFYPDDPREAVDLSLAPVLERLSVSQSIKLPTSPKGLNLTRLHLGRGVPFSDAISVLQFCSQLRQLQWELPLDSSSYRDCSSQQRMHLPLLEKLCFDPPLFEQEGLPAISLIVAPGLSSLVLGKEVMMIPHHFPTVRHLRCHGTSGNMNYLLESLLCFPELEELDAAGILWTESAVESLSHRGPDSEWTLVPRLKRLVWGCGFIGPLSDKEGVGRLLEARNTGQPGDEPSVTLVLDGDPREYPFPPSQDELPSWVTIGENVRSKALSPVDDGSTW